MLYPNKTTQFESSIIYKMLHILEYLNKKNIDEIEIKPLYAQLKSKYKNIDEFIYSLDILYALDKIELNPEKDIITHVKEN